MVDLMTTYISRTIPILLFYFSIKPPFATQVFILYSQAVSSLFLSSIISLFECVTCLYRHRAVVALQGSTYLI